MRIKSLGLWSALLISSFALVAGGCGGDDGGRGTGATTAEGGAEAAEQVITVNWGSEPPSLDPGLASDTTSANILLNIMDPLVKLDEDLNPVPAAAESFETSEDGKTVTFVLRDDLKWTNGDPVTAGDFEYAWKRTVSPELGADYAYQFYGIVGRAGVQQLRSQEGRLRGARRQDGRQGRRRQDPRGDADDAAAVVHAAGGAPLVPRGEQGRGRQVRRQVDRGGEHRHQRPLQARRAGSTTPRSTSSRTTTGATPTASSSPASTAV